MKREHGIAADNALREIFKNVPIEKPREDFTAMIMEKINDEQVKIRAHSAWLFPGWYYVLLAIVAVAGLFIFLPGIYRLYLSVRDWMVSIDLSRIKIWTAKVLDAFSNIAIPTDLYTISIASLILFGLFLLATIPDLVKD